MRIHIPARFSFKAATLYKSVGPYQQTIYILKSKKYLTSTLKVCKFSILFSILFLWYFNGEFVWWSKAAWHFNYFLHSCDCNVWFRGDTVGRNISSLLGVNWLSHMLFFLILNTYLIHHNLLLWFLTLNSQNKYYVTSLGNILTLSSKQVMKIPKLIR